MGKRRALLIGIEKYGEGFASLPAVRQDVDFIGKALGTCGYEVEVVADDDEANARALSNRLREFCEECDEGDVHLIYFSGHGRSVAGRDYLVPARASRDQVDDKENDYGRVKTDYSEYVSDGLVVFIIDACRDATPTKGGEFGYERVGGPQFVRFFGCSEGEVCQVLPAGPNEVSASLFSKALGDALRSGQFKTLNDVLNGTTTNCREMANTRAIKVQVPRLSFGELTTQTDAMLRRRIFDRPVVSTVWRQFDPRRMQCLMITSESESRQKPEWTLRQMVQLATSGKLGRRIWNAFHAYSNNRALLNGQRREVSAPFDKNSIYLASVEVKEAFAEHIFDDIVRGLAEADLVIFDVTEFEPGMMLLMGIRSASRRGVSISTHGAGWRELDAIDVPFNLRDISLGSHAESRGGAGKNPVTEAFVHRVEYGFHQMARQPRYQDLPAYDALRQLGPHYESASTIPMSAHVLVLSSYGKDYRDHNWEYLENLLEGFIDARLPEARILRLIDLGNCQLVSQFLYEQIRRTTGCIVDWTGYSPSTFFELGVRLAVSEWGAIQLADERYLPAGELAGRWAEMTGQIEEMLALFSPFTYRPDGDDTQIRSAMELLLQRNPGLDDDSLRYDRVYRRVSEAIQDVAEAYLPVHDQLIEAADALHHPLQGREGAPQILFRHSRDGAPQLAKAESERAAKELRIAAWLYMEYRLKAGHFHFDDPMRELYEKLGEESANALFDANEVELGQMILDRLQESRG